MKALINLLLVVGFCTGTVGAAGFHTPIGDPEASYEDAAIPLFAAGMVLVVVGGVLERKHRAGAAEAGGSASGKADLAMRLEAIRAIVVELDEEKSGLPAPEVCRRISDLLAGEYFDLTSQCEGYASELGFRDYARVWEGVAIAERLLARTWTLATDGFVEQGIEELPRARQQLEHSAAAAASL